MGLRLSTGVIARFKALPFGASQAPAIFTMIANEFGRLLAITLRAHNIHNFTLTIYVDDILISAPSFAILLTIRAIMDRLADTLGISFKQSKDQGFDQPL